MSCDIPDDIRYVISGRISDAGVIDSKLPLRRLPKVFREKDFYRLPFVGKYGELPQGLEAQPFFREHFLSGARYVEAIFALPVVRLDVNELRLENIKWIYQEKSLIRVSGA